MKLLPYKKEFFIYSKMYYYNEKTISALSPTAKIVSLVPSITELLCDLGLEENIVGVTKFCVHPDHLRKSKPRVGGTKNIQIDTIRSLAPDLIIASKEENVKEQLDALCDDFQILLTDVTDFESGLEMIEIVGDLFSKNMEASALLDEIKKAKSDFQQSKSGTVLYLIWERPFMTVGKDNYIHSMIEEMGLTNLMQDEVRYPEITEREIQGLKPDYIFLSSEPFPFKHKHLLYYQPIFPDSKVILVDGEMFSWYGSRMKYCFEYFKMIQQKWMY